MKKRKSRETGKYSQGIRENFDYSQYSRISTFPSIRSEYSRHPYLDCKYDNMNCNNIQNLIV